MKTETIEAEFRRALHHDALVARFFARQQTHRARRRDMRFKALVVELCRQKAWMEQRITELEAIAPRRFMAPDGKVYLWECPAQYVPIQQIKA